MPEENQVQIEVLKEFRVCQTCGGQLAFHEELKRLKAEGVLPKDSIRGKVFEVKMWDVNKGQKAGDKLVLLQVVKDWCLECGKEQVAQITRYTREVTWQMLHPDVAKKQIFVPGVPGNGGGLLR